MAARSSAGATALTPGGSGRTTTSTSQNTRKSAITLKSAMMRDVASKPESAHSISGKLATRSARVTTANPAQ